MCAACKMHGVRLIKGIKISESMFKNQNLASILTKQLIITFKHQLTWSSISIQTDIHV